MSTLRSVLRWLLVVVTASAACAVVAPSLSAASGECATVQIRARPHVNTSSVPERIASTITSCSATTETLSVAQTITGPTIAAHQYAGTARTWTVTIAAGASVVLVRRYAYSCCGTWRVLDTVSTTTGSEIAHAHRSFVMA